LKTRICKRHAGTTSVLATSPEGLPAHSLPNDGMADLAAERRSDLPAERGSIERFGHTADILTVPTTVDASLGPPASAHRPGVKPRSTQLRTRQATRILVADDDTLTRRLLQKALQQAGYEVVAVENGRMALESLSSKVRPRLALLDWLMPGLNGLEVCRETRRHSEDPYIYIILLTSRTSKEDVVRGLEAGADDYLTKPFDLEELKARLRCGERILKLQDKVNYDALHDPLTRLPNRAFFLERLTLCVSWGILHPEYKFAVLSIDMDRFKVVNDSLGIFAGDWLLVQIAERLLGSIRRDDALLRSANGGGESEQPDGSGIVARLGGDKFTILLDDIRNASEGIRVAERIQQTIQAPFDIEGHTVFATASVGIAFSGTGYSAAEDMLGDANTAMARAKTLGKARYEMCDPSMHATAAGRFRLETDLRRAAENQEFVLHYQPIVSLMDFRITGFEALVRWQRPGGELVMPGGFISVAEDTGLILWIGQWVLQAACRQICAWNLQFPCTPAFTIAVNISAKQFAQPDLVSQIGQVLSETGLAPEILRLELTESLTMRDEERTTRILGELKKLGVRLCIDDFGTGYSSLSYLRRFALDILKIDRSFVTDMLNNSESQEIVKTILSLGANLRMKVIAEGVETFEQMTMLKSLGCEFAQGYLFSRPVNSAALSQTLVRAEAHCYTLPQESAVYVVETARRAEEEPVAR
jgi:predicted signal transduction protein with EAL and GGDEF domain